ncbi:hypothetical protein ACFQZX_14045 [Mucilaginibacter litoreus]|uniref:Natural product n=1 Tax=Mucilaginibacter litoreus TaxID=1048221 RepID=A0ABW3AVD7_9SPHI
MKTLKSTGKLSLKKELSRNEQKEIRGGASGTQTYCDGVGGTPFPNSGSTAIGCQPAYCTSAGHGHFLYCA